jgi:hypothetical protein
MDILLLFLESGTCTRVKRSTSSNLLASMKRAQANASGGRPQSRPKTGYYSFCSGQGNPPVASSRRQPATNRLAARHGGRMETAGLVARI